MSKTRPWNEIGDEIRRDPARAARIDAIKREMDREIAAYEGLDEQRTGDFYGSTIAEPAMAAAPAGSAAKRVVGKLLAPGKATAQRSPQARRPKSPKANKD